MNILSAACCFEYFLDFHWNACEHSIAGTNRSNYFCRTEKRSWSWPRGSCSLPLCLGGLGKHPPLSRVRALVIYHGHLEPWLKCDPAIELTTDILAYGLLVVAV
jgi:hypothetical protein